jgi:tRNA threonylcarbamoyladenosine biosynthesis protein TsaE
MTSPGLVVRTSDQMLALGEALAGVLRAGDLVLLEGPLGAGKTTLTQGIAVGLGVSGAVTSPTFVLAREHDAAPGRPGLVHVDAYRLDDWRQLDDLDLDPAMAGAVTVVEWGRGVAEPLADERLELTITPGEHEARVVTWRTVGRRWDDVDLSRVAAPALP